MVLLLEFPAWVQRGEAFLVLAVKYADKWSISPPQRRIYSVVLYTVN